MIQTNYPQKISFLTTVYVTTMGITDSIASYLSVPITQATSWKGLILCLSMVCLLVTLLVWFPNQQATIISRGHEEKKEKKYPKKQTSLGYCCLGLQSPCSSIPVEPGYQPWPSSAGLKAHTDTRTQNSSFYN